MLSVVLSYTKEHQWVAPAPDPLVANSAILAPWLCFELHQPLFFKTNLLPKGLAPSQAASLLGFRAQDLPFTLLLENLSIL